MYAVRVIEVQDNKIIGEWTGQPYFLFETAHKLDALLLRFKHKLVKR